MCIVLSPHLLARASGQLNPPEDRAVVKVAHGNLSGVAILEELDGTSGVDGMLHRRHPLITCARSTLPVADKELEELLNEEEALAIGSNMQQSCRSSAQILLPVCARRSPETSRGACAGLGGTRLSIQPLAIIQTLSCAWGCNAYVTTVPTKSHSSNAALAS